MGFLKQSKHKFILSIGDEGAILTHVKNRVMVKRMFVSSPSSAEMHAVLATAPETPIYIYVDVVDQACNLQTLPPVSKMNVKKLVDRKLAKDYDAADLKSSICLGKEEIGRKDWKYLFVSVRNIPPLSDWVDTAAKLSNPFAGIFLLPVESMSFLKDLRAKTKPLTPEPSKWQIVVAHNRVGGFRQIVYSEGKILFTRIAQPVGGQTPDVVAGHIEQEILNTIEYIRRLGFDSTGGLDLYVIVAREVRDALDIRAQTANPAVVMTPDEVAKRLNIPSAAEDKDRFADVVMATHFAVTSKHILLINTDLSKKILMLNAASAALKSLSLLTVIIMVGFSGYTFIDSQSLKDKTDTWQSEKVAAVKKLKETKSLFKNFNDDIDKVKETSLIHGKLSKDEYASLELLNQLAQIKGYEMKVIDFKININKDIDATDVITSKFNLELFPDAGVESNIAASLLDKFTDLEADLKTQFPQYEVKFSSNPLEDAKYLDMSDAQAIDLSFKLNLLISTRKLETKGKDKRR